MKMIDLTGRTFSRLTVVAFSHKGSAYTKFWDCVCECGKTKKINGNNLTTGKTLSCGCYRDEQIRLKASKEGKTVSEYSTFVVWRNMVDRCTNPDNKAYARYGGRGIVVCPEWEKDFLKFLLDMGAKPKGLSLDRKDNSKGYLKGNCRWVTSKVQNNNKRSNLVLLYKGEEKTLMEWSEVLNFSYHTVKRRIYRGWSIVDAFEKPIKGKS